MFAAKIFTLYPEFFPGLLDIGMYRRAREKKIWSLDVVNIRDFAIDKHGSVDDKPFGGGSGMLMRPDVVNNCIEKNQNDNPIIYLSPKGDKLDTSLVKQFAQQAGINILCGHFEGVDQRVIEKNNIQEISIGDYVLSGGESAAIVVLDAILRTLPGVLGAEKSLDEETFNNNLLEYPQYTQPRNWEGITVPDVLLSGNHAEIKDWRLEQSRSITQRRRPDLWQKYNKKIIRMNLVMKNIDEINKEQIKKLRETKKLVDFNPGDTVKVNVRIVEGKKQRVQAYEGVCIAKKNRGINSSFTVRKISFGEGVERVFQLYSPNIDSIELMRSGKVRRAKLYYLRDRSGKSARINEKIKKKIGLDVAKEEAVKKSVIEEVAADVETSANQVKEKKESKQEDQK